MKYTELTVHTTNEASEIVADVMWNYTDFGVTVCDVNDIIALQKTKDGYWDYIDENLRDVSRTDVLVKCYLEEATAQKIAAIIRGKRTAQRPPPSEPPPAATRKGR